MASRTSVEGRHKKILRTRVKVWAKYLLKAEETFSIDRAELLIHKALDNKMTVQTTLKMYGDGLKIGDQGVLASLHAEFIPYSNITAFISLRESPTTLALCSKESGSTSSVTIFQFKDLDALEVVCKLIDQQRSIITRGSLSRSDVAPKATPPAPVAAAAPAPTTVVVSTSQPPAPAPVIETVPAPNADIPSQQQPPSPPPEPEPRPIAAAIEVPVVIAETNGGSSSANGGLFEKRPFTSEITQPPDVTAAVVHALMASPPSAAAAATDDDEDNFRTSIVFGESVHTEGSTLESKNRMETVLELRANGHVDSPKSSDYIDAVILNYDEIDSEGTHAVFDTPDGPPIQLNESTENLRHWPNQLLVTANSTPSPGSHGSSSRMVVTSFSSGRSGSPTESRVFLRAASADREPAYRTSAVIYRDAPLPESPMERPRVTYVTNQRSSYVSGATVAPLSPSLQQQPVQLVRLVPVSTARRSVAQPQPQYFTIQPVGTNDTGMVGLATK